MSVRQAIENRKSSARRYAALNVVVAATAASLAATHHWSWLLLTTAAFQVLAFALNVRSYMRARQAQRIYESNPLVAYLAEMRHTFGD